MISFGEAIKTCLFKKFFIISGRARRSEFWWFVLFCYLILFPCIFAVIMEGEKAGLITTGTGSLIFIICYLFLTIPVFTAFIRRLHDTGRSAWSLLWLLVPYVGWVILLIRALSSSDPTNNGYGYDPHLGLLDPFDPKRFVYDPRSLNMTTSDLECADCDSAGNRISSPRSEKDFDNPTDDCEDDYENERCVGEIDRERELYENCRRRAEDALNDYEYYKAKAEENRGYADSRLSSAKYHENYADIDETHKREAQEDYSWAEDYYSKAKEYQKEADRYYEEYQRNNSEADRHYDNLRRLKVYL